MKRATLTLGILVAALAVPSAARAEGLRQEYFFTGDVGGRFDEGSLSIATVGSTLSVSAVEKRKEKRKDKDVAWQGLALLDGRVLTIARPDTPGLAGALEGLKAPRLEYVAEFDKDFETAKIRVYKVTAAGEHSEVGTASLRAERAFWQKVPGELLGLAEKEVEKVLHDERSLSKDFSIESYANLGVRASTKWLRDGDRTARMIESDRLFRAAGKGEPFWLRSVIEGGPRVAWGTSVPLDAAGVFSLNVGFQLGAHLRYQCDDQERLLDGITDGQAAIDLLEKAPARVFLLPLSTARALEMPMGSRRSFDGQGWLAMSGGVTFGYKLDELGVLRATHTEVGLAASVSVHWSLRGEFRLEVEREEDQRVHVRWTKTTGTGVGAAAGALIGLTVKTNTIPMPGPLEAPVSAVVKQGENYTKIEFGAGIDWSKTRELVVELDFDLSDPRAARAYEAAVQGNLIVAQALATEKDPGGLKECRVTDTLTTALSTSAQLKAFRVLNYSRSSRTATVRVDVTSLDGTKSHTDEATYTKNRRTLFGGSTDGMSVDAISREVVHDDQTTERGERASFHYEHEEKRVSWDDADGFLELASRLLGPAVAEDVNAIKSARKGDSGSYGTAKLVLDVALGPKAIEKILTASDDEFYQAYGKACWDQHYNWTPDRVKEVRNYWTNTNPGDESWAEREKRIEQETLRDAGTDLKTLRKAARASSQVDRLAAFRKIAKSDGFQMRGVVALAILAGSVENRISVSLHGKDLALDKAVGSVPELPVHR